MAEAEAPLSEVVDATGHARITITPWAGQSWRINQVSTEIVDVDGKTGSGAPSGSTCYLRKNGNLITTMVTTGDVASGDPTVPLSGNDSLTIDWYGCTTGATVKAYVMYDDGQPA